MKILRMREDSQVMPRHLARTPALLRPMLIAAAAACWLGMAPAAVRAQPGTSAHSPCEGLRQLPRFTAYNLGPRFDGLALEHTSRECFPAPRGASPTHAPGSVWVSTAIYGSCTPEGWDGGCGPPLEIQSWPECARKPGLYEPPASSIDRRESLYWSGTRLIPTVPYEVGISNRVELYDGRTAIVVLTDGPDAKRLARAAAHALARLAERHARGLTIARLRALALSRRGC